MKLNKSLFSLYFLLFISNGLAVVSSVVTFEREIMSNNVRFVCGIPGRRGSYTIKVYSADDMNQDDLVQSVTHQDMFDIFLDVTLTQSNESYFICEYPDGPGNGNSITSSPFYFAAIPPRLDTTTDRRLVIVDNSMRLRCPYELGIASPNISPYHYVWFNGTGSEITNATEQFLNVTVSEGSPDITRYSCALRIRECSIVNSCPVVVFPSQSFRPMFKVKKVVPLDIGNTPDSTSVDFDSMAVFNCSAHGTSLSIEWEYNGMNYTYAANPCTSDLDVCVMELEEPSRDYLQSRFKIVSASMDGTVRCFVRQSFDGTYNNSLPVDDRTFEATLTVAAKMSPTTMATTMLTTTVSTTTEPPTPTDLTIAFVSLGVVAVIAIAVALTIVLSLTFHYHYKYKTDSKLGRFLSRAVSSRPSHRINRDADLPSNGNGEVLSSVFQPASDYHHSSQSHSRINDQEQIYNISQYSKSSGGSYSGLSGVSNQEPGAVHKMPDYCSTDVSGNSTYLPQSSVSNDGLLAPPHTARGSGVGRSQRSSDVSDGSNQSRPKATTMPRLTQELLSQMQKAVSFEGINASQSYGGYPNQLQNNQPHHHSDLGFLSQPRRSREYQPPLHLFSSHSPAGAAVGTNSPYVQGSAPFPHSRTPQNGTAPFPSKHTNKEQRISEDTIETVMKCLMHNKHCRIPNCPCYKIQELYKKNTTGKNGPIMTTQHSTSSDSSDSVSDKKRNLHLSLSSKEKSKLHDLIPQLSGEDMKVHPHYHRGAKTRVRSSNPKPLLERRRSRSVDLSPLGECSESPTKTPTVGASLIAGTPVLYAPRALQDEVTDHQETFGSHTFMFQRPPRSPEHQPDCYNKGSMSADDLPTLCLNDCPLANTSKPRKFLPPSVKRASFGKPMLSPIGEKHKEAESDVLPGYDSSLELGKIWSSDQADSVCDVSVSDTDVSQSLPPRQPVREISRGYHSETLSSEPSFVDSIKLKPKLQKCSRKSGSDLSQRSNSPAYETIVTVSDDGNRVHTTEC